MPAIPPFPPSIRRSTDRRLGRLLAPGFVDGRGFRLRTIVDRPGRLNRAASSFMSSIIRKPPNREKAYDRSGPHYYLSPHYLSPRRCVENLIREVQLDAGDLGPNGCVTMRDFAVFIGEMIAATTAWRARVRHSSGWRWDYRPEKRGADVSLEDAVRYYSKTIAPA